MRILLSAFAFEPNRGSEHAVGWHTACELAKLGHEVTVLSVGLHHRPATDEWIATHPETPPIRIVWHDLPWWPRANNHTYALFLFYHAWHITARKLVKELMKRETFDVVHHLTWGAWRWANHLGGLGPKHIFGPVGGGMSVPLRLRHSLSTKGKLKEYARDIGNWIAWLDPTLWLCLHRSDRILATDAATRRWVHPWWRGKVELLNQLACTEVQATPGHGASKGQGLRLLSVGRIELWKGTHLALGAFRLLLAEDPAARFTIIGTGPDLRLLKVQAKELGVDAQVDWVDHLPNDQLQEVYARHDVLVFPSMHDIGGVVVAEGLSRGLPAIVLDHGDDAGLVDRSCGRLVPIAGLDRAGIERGLAAAMIELAGSHALLAALSAGAIARAASRSWQAFALSLEAHYQEVSGQRAIPPAERLLPSSLAPTGAADRTE